ncbi:MAG TPA: hypothetical protein ENG30_03190, partial [Thermofilaceae archaeon]|nr:hypothetical protein [Thermofilaceae archaeon]
GAAGEAPENTLKAILRGINCGAKYIEIDVRRTRDGALVLMHDETVDRTTNGSGRVSEMTLEELKKLDAGEGEAVPTLKEALEVVKGKAVLLLELKEAGYERHVWQIVSSHGMEEEVIFISFLPRALSGIAEASGGKARLGLIFYAQPQYWLEVASRLKVEMVAPHYRLVTADFVRMAKKRLFTVNPWTVNEERIAEKMMRLDVDLLTTDYPCRMIRFLRQVTPLA